MQKHKLIRGFAKFELVLILGLMSSIAPLSIDMYLPALKNVQESFQTSETLTQLSIASFFVAFALGQLIYGPLSDIFGRKKPLIIGLSIFMLASLGCVLVDNVQAFIALRFLEALGGCAGVVIARAIVNDIFELKEAAAMFALMMVVSNIAPMLSPSLGGILLQIFSWQSIFFTLFVLGALLLISVIFVLKESANSRANFSKEQILKNYAFVLKDRAFLVYSFSAGIAICAMFAYITGSSFVFINHFGVSEQIYAALFGINAVGLLIGSSANAKIVQIYSPKKVLEFAFLAMLFVCAVAIACSYFGLWAYETSIFFMLVILGFVMSNAVTLAMARFKEQAGTASAVLGASQFALAGIASGIVSAMGANTPLYMAIAMGVCAILACLTYFVVGKNAIKIG